MATPYNLIMKCNCCNQELPEIEKEEIPVLVGYTTKVIGFQGLEKIPIGSPIYEFRGILRISTKFLNSSVPVEINYHKDKLSEL